MTRIELLEYLTKEAKALSQKPSFISNNQHLTGISESDMPSEEQINGILVAFINFVGLNQGVDFALSFKDLKKK